MENEEKHLPALPSEIWLHVFSFLSVRELLQSAAVVNKLWHHLVSDEPLWKHNFASTWGRFVERCYFSLTLFKA